VHRLAPIVALGIGILRATYSLAADAAAENAPRQVSHLKLGTFFYRDLDHGTEVGRSVIRIERLPGGSRYRFTNDANFAADFSGFSSQHWEAVTGSGFEPVSASLAFTRESGSATVFELTYARRRVGGFAVKNAASSNPLRRSVGATVRDDTVDQRIDWAAAIGGELTAGLRSRFSVFDPGSGVSEVQMTVWPMESVTAPAGVYAAFRITYEVTKLNKLERYVVFAAGQPRRMMIREEFPNGAVTELVSTAE
jgi:hypothetical protein